MVPCKKFVVGNSDIRLTHKVPGMVSYLGCTFYRIKIENYCFSRRVWRKTGGRGGPARSRHRVSRPLSGPDCSRGTGSSPPAVSRSSAVLLRPGLPRRERTACVSAAAALRAPRLRAALPHPWLLWLRRTLPLAR